MPMEKSGLTVIVLLLFLCASLVACICASHAGFTGGASDREARSAAIQTMGFSSLCLSPECTGARNMTEGICGSMTDIPAGYCCHEMCNVVSPPPLPGRSLYRMEIVRTGQ